MLSVAFVTLIAGSMGFVAADHLESGQGVYVDAGTVNLVVSTDTKFQIYLQAVIRNGDDQLVNVTENTRIAAFLDHNLTDHVFDTLMGKKEIVTIDNIKYEKVQYMFTPTLVQRNIGYYPIFSELTVEFEVEEDVYKKMNEEKKDHSIWKIHYCAEFDGHGYRCVPIFQALMPTLTLEPGDPPPQQWTILRDLS